MVRINVLVIALLLLSFVSCASVDSKQEQIVVFNQEEIDPWLISISGDKPAEISVEGKWHDPESLMVKKFKFSGWGVGQIYQNGNKLSGAIGGYNVRGIVSANIVYVVFYSDGIVDYTARLEMVERGVLEGQYFDADDRKQINGYSIKFIVECQ